ncbi:nitroreductase family protein [Bacillus anthracis]|nr:nitroreductase family protein [Bacillus anthracis]AJH86006.1 nitroreductase family protein [Bacillus anthracis]
MSATTTNLKEAIVNRRSIRKVTKNDAITKERIEEVLKTALHAPTSFNMQSGRMVVLMDGEHEKFWDIVKETLRARVPAENFEATVERLKGFHAGVGTVLFFEDQATVEKMQENAPLYKDRSHSGLIKEMRCYNILCGCYYLLKELGRHYNITTQS